MKTIRNLMTVVGLSLLLPVLAVTVAKAQSISANPADPEAAFSGSFTLPFEVQWGSMVLPAGDYTLDYGRLIDPAGMHAVAITAEENGGKRGVLLADGRGQSRAGANSLVYIRQGDTLIVTGLELPAIGESVTFKAPKSAQLMARKNGANARTQLAKARMPIQRLPIRSNGK